MSFDSSVASSALVRELDRRIEALRRSHPGRADLVELADTIRLLQHQIHSLELAQVHEHQIVPHLTESHADIVGKHLVGLALGLETLRLGGTHNQAPHLRQDVFNTFMQEQAQPPAPRITYNINPAPSGQVAQVNHPIRPGTIINRFLNDVRSEGRVNSAPGVSIMDIADRTGQGATIHEDHRRPKGRVMSIMGYKTDSSDSDC
jgi:hypothetical protein